jgi:DNA invertase Pin-like site-specific DNA recombinase
MRFPESIREASAFAEFERSMIRQRINAGLKRAKAAGKQLGRPRIEPALEKSPGDQFFETTP